MFIRRTKHIPLYNVEGSYICGKVWSDDEYLRDIWTELETDLNMIMEINPYILRKENYAFDLKLASDYAKSKNVDPNFCFPYVNIVELEKSVKATSGIRIGSFNEKANEFQVPILLSRYETVFDTDINQVCSQTVVGALYSKGTNCVTIESFNVYEEYSESVGALRKNISVSGVMGCELRLLRPFYLPRKDK